MRDTHHLTLANWRREVTVLYGRLRQEEDPHLAWLDFRRTRDTLFKRHPQSPLNMRQREMFNNVRYFPYNHELRIEGSIAPVSEPEMYSVDLPDEGIIRFSRIGTIHFVVTGEPTRLNLYWIEGYGGGLFLPFRDATNGHGTYGGGRYLYDTIKGADLGAGTESIMLDFNFAYNPSCAYDDRWVCPLAPPANWLPIEIKAGEKNYVQKG
jgi:uncharacterized protein (DUF1684 family)